MKNINGKQRRGVYLKELNKIVSGKIITNIRISKDYLVIEMGDEYVSFGVEGDCCSDSYFFDVFGGQNLKGKEIVEISSIELDPTDLKIDSNGYGNVIKVYGYKISCKPNDDLYGTSNTAVFSFRNSSNGYYGGWMNFAYVDPQTIPEVTNDIYEVA